MRQFIRQLHNLGYTEAGTVEPGVDVMYVIQNGIPYVICYIDMDIPQYKSRERLDSVEAEVRELFTRIAYDNVVILKILCTDDLKWVEENLSDCCFYWVFDKNYRRIVIYENQPGDFLGIKSKIDDYLYGRAPKASNFEREDANPYLGYRAPKQSVSDYLTVTNILIIINCFVFLITALGGDVSSAKYLRKCGGMYAPDIMFRGQVYRLFTSTFLHGGFMHLVSNMFSLYCIGEVLEPLVGKVKYLIIYMGGGLLASLTSFIYHIEFENNAVCVGASGCVFAIMGAWPVMLVVKSANVTSNTVGYAVAIMALCVIEGFRKSGVDNAAHVGGLIAGVVITYIMYRLKKRNS